MPIEPKTGAATLNLIFPMAGQGARFGYVFKPFLPFGGRTFIQAAVDPFLKWRGSIARIWFVYLEGQEQSSSVSTRLAEMFDGLAYECVRLSESTEGPAETVATAVELAAIAGPTILCDCDHRLDVDPLFSVILGGTTAECVLPVWPLEGEDLRAWSVASVGPDRAVTGIAEKAMPTTPGEPLGVIGCYFFKEVADLARLWMSHREPYISDAIRRLIEEGRAVEAVRLHEAVFFGDPRRLEAALEQATDE